MIYLIKKGHHFARFNVSRLWPFSAHCIYGTVRFSASCWHSRDSIKLTGWNKLTGISSLLIHRNSGRLVWQPDFNHPGRILIAAYVYRRGVRISQAFASCEVEKEIEFTVIGTGGIWSFGFGDNIRGIPGKTPIITMKAFPYFGGRSTAPQNMTIVVKRHKCFD
jgi:hypothetical protein